MTTHDERLRALAWGRELMQDLVADPSMKLEMRDRAAALLNGYPEADSIKARLEDLGDAALLDAAQKIEGTIGLLAFLQREPSEAWAERARHVERHFPTGDAPRGGVSF